MSNSLWIDRGTGATRGMATMDPDMANNAETSPANLNQAMMRTLQSENDLLRQRLQQLEERKEQLEAERDDDQEEEEVSSSDNSEEKDVSLPSNNQKNTPLYGKNENPIRTKVLGLIDGRSNARLCFEERCQLLRDFKADFGHTKCPIPLPTSYPIKYAALGNWLQKQRASLKMYKREGKGGMTPERFSILNEIGIDWGEKKDKAEEWNDYYQQLKLFREKYGHCCVSAVVQTQQASAEDETEEKDESDYAKLKVWTVNQRRVLQNWIKQGCKHVDETNSKEPHGGTRTEESKEDEGTTEAEGEASNGKGAEETEFQRKVWSAGGVLRSKYKQKQTRPGGVPRYFTTEHQLSLQSLNCDWLNGSELLFQDKEEIPKDLKKLRSWKPNTMGWYVKLEELRRFIGNNKSTFVARVCSGEAHPFLATWIRERRKLYDVLRREDDAPEDPVRERNIAFLARLGLDFDGDSWQREQDRILKEKQAKAKRKSDEEFRLQSSQYLFEQAEKKLLEAKELERQAKKALTEASKRTRIVQKEYTAAAKRRANDPVGKIVTIRDRGNGRPSGPAKILSVWPTKIMNEIITFYHVEFVSNKCEEKHIHEMFVSFPDDLINTAEQRPKKKTKPEKVVTRGTSKLRESSEVLMALSRAPVHTSTAKKR